MSDPTKVLINSMITYGNHLKTATKDPSEESLTTIHNEVTNLTCQLLKQLQNDQHPLFPEKIILKILEKIEASLQKFKELDPYRSSAYEDLLNKTKECKSQKKQAFEKRSASSAGVSLQQDASPANGESTQAEGSASDGPGQQQEEFTRLGNVEKKCLFCFCLFPPGKAVKKREPVHLWIGMGLVADSLEGSEMLNRLVGGGFIECTIGNSKMFKRYLMKQRVRSVVVKEMNIEFEFNKDTSLCIMYQNQKQKQPHQQEQPTASQQQQHQQEQPAASQQQQQPTASQQQQPQKEQPATSSQLQQPQQEQPTMSSLQQQQQSPSQQQQHPSTSQDQQQQLEQPTTSKKQQQQQEQLSAPQKQQQEPQSPSQQTASMKILRKRMSGLKRSITFDQDETDQDGTNQDDINVSGSLVLNINKNTTLQSKNFESIFKQKNSVKVLLLGNWFHNIKTHTVVEAESLKALTRQIGQVAFLSLQGVSGIVGLPDSVYKLVNLKVLDLRGCPNLEFLPDGIESLTKLTHLDLSECYLLDHIPKGIISLTELRVLKGFIINPDVVSKTGNNKNIKNQRNTSSAGASFSELKALEKLKKLAIRTRRGDFPTADDLVTLCAMKELANLKIAWVCNYKNDVSSISESGRFPASLKKLELEAIPVKTLPRLIKLISDDKQNSLQKLYIIGGRFWHLGLENYCLPHVHTVRLRYLHELHVDWVQLKEFCPNVSRLEVFDCPNLLFLPCDQNGVWELDIVT